MYITLDLLYIFSNWSYNNSLPREFQKKHNLISNYTLYIMFLNVYDFYIFIWLKL